MGKIDGIKYPQSDLDAYNELIKNNESFKRG